MRQLPSYFSFNSDDKSDFLPCFVDGAKTSGNSAPAALSFSTSSAPAPASSAFVSSAIPSSSLMVDGTVDPGDFTVFAFTLEAGETYLVSLFGSGASPLEDTFLSVYDPNFALVGYDDDGGAAISSLLTFTAATSGTYYMLAEGFGGAGGTVTLDVIQSPGVDTVGEEFVGAAPLTLGEITYGFINEGSNSYYGPGLSEVDTYTFSATAGNIVTIEVSGGADYESDYTALPDGELDTIIFVYDSAGNLIAQNDDISFPSNINSRLSFIVPEDGIYFLDVASYSPWTGGYSIVSSEAPPPNPADYDPLDAINWVNAANVTFDDTNTAYVFFGDAGETFGEGGESFGWTSFEIQQVMQALEEYEHILGVNYEITTDVNQATFRLFTTTSTEFGAYFYPQDPGFGSQQGIGAFNLDSGGWSRGRAAGEEQPSLVQGGFSFAVILHEFGHAHGLSHPHDTGGGSEIMLGVTGVSSVGLFDLNQGVYTVMSYNDGWQNHPDGPYNLSIANLDHGWSGSLSAFDIAVLQQRYGVHDYNDGDTVYTLNDSNTRGTFYQTIWDSSGDDTIQYDGADDAQIDLLAATLDYTATGGGVVSYVSGIFGGFTIANGVVIENATGGEGNDLLLGNSSDNVLRGNGGDDVMMGREGDDTFFGGAGSNELTGGDGADTFVLDGAFKGLGTNLVNDFHTPEDSLYLTNMAGMKVVFEQVDEDAFVSFDNALMATLVNADAVEALYHSTFHNSPRSTTLIIDGVKVQPQIEGTTGEDKLVGIAGAKNNIFGYDGNDTISGKGKADILMGNSGDDILDGANGNDKLYGGADNDVLNGGNGNDTLKGGTGNDLLYGGNGDDILCGGEGSDVFQFDVGNKKAGVDHVTDYNVLDDSLLFTTTPASVTFLDSSDGAEMYINGKLSAIFAGVTASDMAGEVLFT